MSSGKDAWGIEVGSQAIKVIKLARTATGVALEDFDVLPFKQVLTTPDLNVEEAIRVNLESLAQKHEFDKSTVVVSVPGNAAFARFAKLPPIESNKVKSIVAYEAQQQIPFPIEEVEWDYHVFEEEDAPDIEVGIFAITKEKVAHFLSNYRAVGVRVDTLNLSPVAVYNAFAYENDGGAEDKTVYLDIGTNSTDIIVVEAGSIWLRTLQLGGNHFTHALMKQFKISFAKAEKLKLEAKTSKYAKQIFQAMRGVFSELVTEIERSLGFYTSLNRDAELTRIVGVGSTWKLPGLQKYLKQNLRMDVVRPDGFKKIEIDDRRASEFSSVAVNMATAYGLALQGLGVATVDANILPQSILQERLWKAKRPWIAAAAACVAAAPLIGTGVMLLSASSYESALSTARPEITPTINEAQAFKTQYEEVQTNDPRPGIRNYRRTFDYVNLYPKLMTDVASAMSKIEPADPIKNVNWNDPDALEQIAQLSRQQRNLAWITDIQTQYIPPPAPDPNAVGAADSGPSSQPGGSAEFNEGSPLNDGFGGGGDGGGGFGGGGFGGGNFGLSASGPADAALVPVIPFPQAQSDSQSTQVPGDPSAAPEPLSPAEDTVSPRVVVTVRGATTMDRVTISRNLQEKFMAHLQGVSGRSDRPYVIVTELKNPRFFRRGTTTGSQDEGFGGGRDRSDDLQRQPTPKADPEQPRPGGLLGGGEFGAGPGLDSDFGSPGTTEGAVEIQTPEGWYAKLGSGSSFSANSLIPRRPLSTEDTSSDVAFEFQFEVILLPPDEARPSILAEPDAEVDRVDTETPQAETGPQASDPENQA